MCYQKRKRTIWFSFECPRHPPGRAHVTRASSALAYTGAHAEGARWLCVTMVAVAHHLEAGVSGNRCEGEASGRRHCFAALTLAHAQHGAGCACGSESGGNRGDAVCAFTM